MDEFESIVKKARLFPECFYERLETVYERQTQGTNKRKRHNTDNKRPTKVRRAFQPVVATVTRRRKLLVPYDFTNTDQHENQTNVRLKRPRKQGKPSSTRGDTNRPTAKPSHSFPKQEVQTFHTVDSRDNDSARTTDSMVNPGTVEMADAATKRDVGHSSKPLACVWTPHSNANAAQQQQPQHQQADVAQQDHKELPVQATATDPPVQGTNDLEGNANAQQVDPELFEPDEDAIAMCSQWIMPITSDPVARRLAKPTFRRAAMIVKTHNFLNDPLSPFAKYRAAAPVTGLACVYVILSEDMQTVLKAGYATNGKLRRGHYEKQGIDPKRFVVVVEFDNLTKQVHDELEQEYEDLMEIMINSDKLHPVQRLYFEMLYKRGGDRLGGKRVMMLQMIEIGLQLDFNLGGPQECIMFDRRICNETYATAAHLAEIVLEKLSVLLEAAKSGRAIRIRGVCSWKPLIDYLSSEIESIRSVLGTDNWVDPLGEPANPDARTRKERYSTDYTPQQIAAAKQLIRDEIQDLLDSPVGVTFLNTNQLCFPNMGILDVLVEEFGFFEVLSLLNREITLFLDPTELRVVIVHRPLSLSSDSRKWISLIIKILRTLTEAVMKNIRLRVEGKPFLCPNAVTVDSRDPIAGNLCYQIQERGFHQGIRQRAAFFRDCVSPASTNALTFNGLRKTQTSEAPATQPLRRKEKQPPKEKTLDWSIRIRARSIIDHATPGQEEDLYQALIRLVQSGGKNPSAQTYRWNSILSIVVKGTKLEKKLVDLRDDLAANKGNPLKGKGKARTTQEVLDGNGHLARLIATHGPSERGQPGTYFWVRNGTSAVRPEDGAPTNSAEFPTFPGDFEVFTAFQYGGIQNRFKDKPSKQTTDTGNAQYYPQYSIIGVKTRPGVAAPMVKALPTGAPKKEKGFVLACIQFSETDA